ncbi:hypothetical protein GFJ94_01495 [Flavobacterium sp. LMO8]|uniref:DUF6452 family protein n=1 Tax=Flavobacterium sp. LMO8 TaxID=2654244 RepID=UPI001290A84E|nr:DUF6452 family protein [Flavobacterium sp. LMO8]MQP23734.1 hypothetical protein [Flavobacterium sp. LMO8]
MKKLVFITLSLLLAVSFWNCEKDDICAEGTPVTPRLIIEFYDATNPSVLKNITNLGIIEPTFTQGFPFNGVSKIQVPLRTTADITTLNFIQNGSDTDSANDNIDLITFNYERINEYVSRACGYKTLFYLNDINPIELTADGNNWIQNIEVMQPNIETENEVHVKIYF